MNTKNLSLLRKATPARKYVPIEYTIQNVSTRLNPKPLQVTVRILGANAKLFKVNENNPKIIGTVASKATKKFTIPLIAKSANLGCVLETEVKEDGQVVLVNRTKF